MEPVTKELKCPSCGQAAAVRLMPGSDSHNWHCPHCKKLQTTDKAAADSAPETQPVP